MTRNDTKPILAAGLLVLGLLDGPAVFAVNQVRIGDSDLPGDAIRRTIEKQAEARGRGVSITGSVSEMTVRPSPDDRIHVKANLGFWSDVEEWMLRVEKEFDVEILESPDTVGIRVELPELEGHKRARVHYDITLTVTVPVSTPLEISNEFGSVDVEGIKGPARIHNSSGEINLSQAAGAVDLEGRFGAIRVQDVQGDLKAENSSGELEVRRISGRADLVTQFGDLILDDVGGAVVARVQSGGIRASNLRGDVNLGGSFGDASIEQVHGSLTAVVESGSLTALDVRKGAELETSFGTVTAGRIGADLIVRARSGGITVSDLRGGLRAEGSFGDVEVRGVAGPVVVSLESGNVTLADVRGDAEIGCSFGTVRAGDVKGNLSVNGQSTPVQAERITGGVIVETTFGGVSVEGAGGGVTVRNQSGSVTVKGLTGAALTAEHRIDTSFGDIRFAWPKGSGATFSLESTFGSIRTGLPLTVRESSSRTTADGTTGDARARITLSAESGSVIVEED